MLAVQSWGDVLDPKPWHKRAQSQARKRARIKGGKREREREREGEEEDSRTNKGSRPLSKWRIKGAGEKQREALKWGKKGKQMRPDGENGELWRRKREGGGGRGTKERK